MLEKTLTFFEWGNNIADRLAFIKVLTSGEPFTEPMRTVYQLFRIDSKEMLSLEKYLQEYFSKIMKKLKELNNLQNAKFKDTSF